jgi:hypothetical protein
VRNNEVFPWSEAYLARAITLREVRGVKQLLTIEAAHGNRKPCIVESPLHLAEDADMVATAVVLCSDAGGGERPSTCSTSARNLAIPHRSSKNARRDLLRA